MERLFIILGLLAAGAPQAKCVTVPYTVAGTVVASTDQSPIRGALVALAWSDAVNGNTLERTAHTDASGKYSIEVPFYPWSGNVHGADQCSANLTEVAVLVAASGFVQQQSNEPVTGKAITANYSLKRTAAE